MSSGMIGIIASDMRQIYMADMLKEKGYQVQMLNLMEEQPLTKERLDEAEELWQAEALILPVPVSKINNGEWIAERIARHSDTIKQVYGGVFPEQWKKRLEPKVQVIDILKDETIAQKNAIATAEGTVAELLGLMPVNLEGARVTVFGFGKCGKIIAEKLYCMGAKVSVVARSGHALELAHFFGFEAIDIASEDLKLAAADALINTIPAPVITKKEISLLKRDAVIVDIASAPGGCDKACCKEKGIPCRHALGLPGIYSPKTSALILLQVMPF